VSGTFIFDCPIRDFGPTCPYFERIRIQPNGKVIVDKWAYFRIDKEWVELVETDINLGYALADTVFDGVSWAKPQLGLQAREQAESEGPWLYGYGNVEYQLNVTASSIAGDKLSGGITYPEGSKSVTLAIEQKSGVLYSLTVGDGVSSSDDVAQYPNVAALRAAHASVEAPLCLADYDKRLLVYFDEATHAAGLAYTAAACREAIGASDKLKAVESGVVTLAGRPVIAVQVPEATAINLIPSREQQILAIIGLDAEGYAANGLAYLPGYTTTLDGYYNLAAFEAWLATQTTDAAAKVLP
jgi:hypothetical protein